MEINLYSMFMFYRMQADFRKMPQNVQITAKQEFENLLASQQNRIFIRTYMTHGINENSDLMIWRMGRSLSRLQEMSAAMQKTGFGKWLDTSKSFTCIAEISVVSENNAEKEADATYGTLPYLLVRPLNGTAAWRAMEANAKNAVLEADKMIKEYSNISFFHAKTFGQHDYMNIMESSSAENLNVSLKKFEEINAKENYFLPEKGYFCIGRDISEILDFLA